MIDRMIFDRHLLQCATEAGADVMVKTKTVGLGLDLGPGNARGKKVVL